MYDRVYVPDFSFGSPLTGLITELEKLRNEDNILFKGFDSVGSNIFLALKDIFQIVESVASARIEGNRTTIAQFIKERTIPVSGDIKRQQKRQEILNIYDGISFIDRGRKRQNELIINNGFFSQLHQILMNDLLTGNGHEGDINPGSYRDHNVEITLSKHIPPDYTQVNSYMDELIDFINTYKVGEHQYDLLKVAIAHHRFVWIHPYGNGNGRMVRLLTYALLIKFGFDIGNFGLLNPSSLFALDREKYYNHLSAADDGSEKGLLDWSNYAISAISEEAGKLELLCEKSFVINTILHNAVRFLYNSGVIDIHEEKILKIIYEKGEISAKDVKGDIKLHPVSISGKLKHLKELQLIAPVYGKKTVYKAIFLNDDMFNAIFHELANNGFDDWLKLNRVN